MNSVKTDKEFIEFIKMYEEAKRNACYEIACIANKATIDLYWEFGKKISKLSQKAKYGDKIVPELAKWFKDNYPEIKGFDKTNLFDMQKYYELFYNDEKFRALRGQLNWTNT